MAGDEFDQRESRFTPAADSESARVNRVAHRPVRVLLVLDQPDLVRMIALALPADTWQIGMASASTATAGMLVAWQPDLVIVDRDLAEGHILAHLGYTWPPSAERLPIIALARSNDLQSTLETFDCGVDDLLAVPFAPEELCARMVAVLRRTYGEAMVLSSAA